MPDPNIELLKKESYVKAIENAPGTRLFASYFVRDKATGEVRDIMNDGELSCAAFASGMMAVFSLIDRPRATVDSLRKAMPEFGWTAVAGEPQPGDVLFWTPVAKGGAEVADGHGHVGFSVGNGEAVSNSSSARCVARHSVTYGTNPDGSPVRPPVAAFRPPYGVHPKLVRDGIPARIVAKGEPHTSHVAAPEELRTLLRAKIREEADELLRAANPEDALGEIADLCEVLDAYGRALGFSPEQAAEAQAKKRAERGGFDGGIVLDTW